jgi:hypothetical protein
MAPGCLDWTTLAAATKEGRGRMMRTIEVHERRREDLGVLRKVAAGCCCGLWFGVPGWSLQK